MVGAEKLVNHTRRVVFFLIVAFGLSPDAKGDQIVGIPRGTTIVVGGSGGSGSGFGVGGTGVSAGRSGANRSGASDSGSLSGGGSADRGGTGPGGSGSGSFNPSSQGGPVQDENSGSTTNKTVSPEDQLAQDLPGFGATALVNSYCLEGDEMPPSDVESYRFSAGRIRIFYSADPDVGVEMDLLEAVNASKIRIRPAEKGAYEQVRVWLSKDITKVEFIENSAIADEEGLLEGPDVEYQALVDSMMRPFDPSRSQEKNQSRLWNHEEGRTWPPPHYKQLVESRTEGLRTLRTLRSPSRDNLQIFFKSLAKQADSSLVQMPSGENVIHDLGFSREEMEAILKRIPSRDDKKKHVDIVITHPDLDHYVGLEYLLEREDVVVHEFVVGTLPSCVGGLPDDNPCKLSGRFSSLYQQLIGTEHELDSQVSTLVRLNRKDARSKYPIRDLDGLLGHDDPLLVTRIDMNRGSGFAILRTKKTGKGRHAHNLACYYSHGGFSILDLSDSDPPQLRVLLESESMPPVNVLKWPHHAWYNSTHRQLMIDLIEKLRPQEVVVSIPQRISVPGQEKDKYHRQWERFAEIKRLLEELSEDWLRPIQIRTLDRLDLQLIARLHLGSSHLAAAYNQRRSWAKEPTNGADAPRRSS